jgi:hypothetical protein
MSIAECRARGSALAFLGQWHSFSYIREVKWLWLMASFGAALALPTAFPALAEEPPPLRVILRPDLITEVADQALPFSVNEPASPADVASQQLTLTELLYCGTDSGGDGRMLGVVDEGNAPTRASSLQPSDCNQPLATIAARELRVPGTPEWVEAARLRLTWQPWRLSLAIADAASAARPGYTAPNLLLATSPGASFPTSGVQPLTGQGRNLRFDLAIGFRRDGIVIDAYPSGSSIDPNINFPSNDTLSVQIQAAPAAANVIAAARYEFVNQMLSVYSPTFDIPVSVQGLSTTLLAREVSVKGSDNQLTLTGKMISQNLAYDSRVDCAGDDLAVQHVAMEAAGVNCAQPDMMSWLQCQAGHGMAAALTAYYQNQPLHISTQSRPLHFTFEGTNYEAYFTALKTSSHGGVLSEAGQATLQRVSHELPFQHD